MELLSTTCTWCPRLCGANRAAGERGVCGADDTLRVARAALHLWEEPPISGSSHAGASGAEEGPSGSGTIFFSNCPLHCAYCQNAPIAAGLAGVPISVERLAEICLELQGQGALNINMVTPTHYTGQIIQALALARRDGLQLPVVWNTSGYETLPVIEALRGTVDVYLADFKYAQSAPAQAYSHAPDYPQVALAAIEAMLAQVGEAQFDEYRGQQRLVRGVVIRHLMLPGHLDASLEAVRVLHERFSGRALISLMNQYTPVISPESPVAKRYPQLLSPVPQDEYETLLDFADSLGMEDYFWQAGPADSESFIPAFDLTGVLR